MDIDFTKGYTYDEFNNSFIDNNELFEENIDIKKKFKEDPIEYLKCKNCKNCIFYDGSWCCSYRSRGYIKTSNGCEDWFFEPTDLDNSCAMFDCRNMQCKNIKKDTDNIKEYYYLIEKIKDNSICGLMFAAKQTIFTCPTCGDLLNKFGIFLKCEKCGYCSNIKKHTKHLI